MSGHVFVDESKHRGYLLVAVVVLAGDLYEIRKLLRGLVLPGQRRLHMKDESDPRKRLIASAIAGSGVRATVYEASSDYRTEREARAACLRELVGDAAQQGHTMLILEQDDTLIAWDRKVLYQAARHVQCADQLRYDLTGPA